MPQLTEIYNVLMDDPDVVPPENVAKEDYAMLLARQRVKQHENNEKALGLGLSKLLDYTSSYKNGGVPHTSVLNKNNNEVIQKLFNFLSIQKNMDIDKDAKVLRDKYNPLSDGVNEERKQLYDEVLAHYMNVFTGDTELETFAESDIPAFGEKFKDLADEYFSENNFTESSFTTFLQ